MQRISVIGSSGSGKTTVARRLSRVLGLPHLELDSVFHQPGWEPLPDPEFRARLEEFASGPKWVVDGNYTSHGTAELVWPRADSVVWLDLPRRSTTWRVTKRTIKRAVTREELWNGNREPLTNLYSPDPYKNIVVWSWTRHRGTRHRYEEHQKLGTWSHCEVHRLRSRTDVEVLLASL